MDNTKMYSNFIKPTIYVINIINLLLGKYWISKTVLYLSKQNN